MEALLATYPQVRIIHLIRDPRAVAVSRLRRNDESTMSRYTMNANKNKTFRPAFSLREVSIYCRTVVQDILLRHQLEERFPGRILTVRYEDFVNDLHDRTQDIYRFIGTEVSTQMLGWIKCNQDEIISGLNSTAIAVKWMNFVTAAENHKVVNEICRDFFQLVGNKWPTWQQT